MNVVSFVRIIRVNAFHYFCMYVMLSKKKKKKYVCKWILYE